MICYDIWELFSDISYSQNNFKCEVAKSYIYIIAPNQYTQELDRKKKYNYNCKLRN